MAAVGESCYHESWHPRWFDLLDCSLPRPESLSLVDGYINGLLKTSHCSSVSVKHFLADGACEEVPGFHT
jgi:hypothetical protein